MNREFRRMAATTYEKGIEEGQRRMLRSVMEKRFGPLSPTAQARLNAWPADRLEEFGVAMLKAGYLKELGLED